MPEACRSGSHFEVASRSIPCRAIGGDFYDYFDLTGGAFGFALGDVAGKGPSAALLTAMIHCLDANRQCSPAELLERLLSAVRSFALVAPQYDDVTALVLRYKVT